MNAIPAKCWVPRRVMVTPPGIGRRLTQLWLPPKKLGWKKFIGGGAQAIAALAYGTETIQS